MFQYWHFAQFNHMFRAIKNNSNGHVLITYSLIECVRRAFVRDADRTNIAIRLSHRVL